MLYNVVGMRPAERSRLWISRYGYSSLSEAIHFADGRNRQTQQGYRFFVAGDDELPSLGLVIPDQEFSHD